MDMHCDVKRWSTHLPVLALLLGFAGNAHAALAEASASIDWSSFVHTETGGLTVDLVPAAVAPPDFAFADFVETEADGAAPDSDGQTDHSGSILASSIGPSDSATASSGPAATSLAAGSDAGFAYAAGERYFDFSATGGSGRMILSLDVAVSAAVAGIGDEYAYAEVFMDVYASNGASLNSSVLLELDSLIDGAASGLQDPQLIVSINLAAGDYGFVDIYSTAYATASAGTTGLVPLPPPLLLFGSGLLALIPIARRR
jgi:hypothetical protein